MVNGESCEESRGVEKLTIGWHLDIPSARPIVDMLQAKTQWGVSLAAGKKDPYRLDVYNQHFPQKKRLERRFGGP